MSIFTRKDIRKLTSEEKDNLVRAFKGIQELPPDNPNSFFAISGLHGQPFRGAGYANKEWWGGYCNHGNVLFPTWHRAYLLHLEKALRTIDGCNDVALPYWNQMEPDGESVIPVIPVIFLQKKYILDGKEIDNPLYSYTLQQGFFDNLSRPSTDYGKPKGYKTVRYPYSGLVGPENIDATNAHNDQIDISGMADAMLIDNVARWLKGRSPTKPWPGIPGIRELYLRSLQAPNYTAFSNTTSATKWNNDKFDREDPGHHSGELVTSLESPHNSLHLAVGGYDMPDDPNGTGANGDMGENDTASFDPIFYFHHCFVDRVFWSWQVAHKSTSYLDVIPEYPGTNSVDNQGPTPGVLAGSWLTMDSPLSPFQFADGGPLTSRDVVNIRALEYEYDSCLGASKPDAVSARSLTSTATPTPTPTIRVSGINRAHIAGSFIVSLWSSVPDDGSGPGQEEPEKILVGVAPVFSRWHVPGCANCGNSLMVTAHMPLVGWDQEEADKRKYTVKVVASRETGGKKYYKPIDTPKIELGKLHYSGV